MKNFYKFLFFAILSLNCSAVWGDGNPSFLGSTMDLTVNNAAQSSCYNDGATAELGNVTALQWNNFSFRMTKYESEGKIGNLCGEAWCHYSLGLTSEVDDWQDISQTNIKWNYNDNSNDVQYEGTVNMDLVSGKPSGNYILKYCFYAHGNYYYSGGCSTSYWYPGNSGNYQITYTILPPNVKANNLKVTASNVISGEGTETKPWLVLVGNTLTLSGNTSTLDWNDANSSVYLSTSQSSGYAAILEYSAQQPDATVQSVTVYSKCYNSTDNLYSKTARSKTVYYQFVQPRTVNFNAGTGTCADESLTEASYGAGITLPTATPQSACADAGWTFAGWAKTSQAETAIAPELLAAGANYKPTSDGETLYAVYALSDASLKKLGEGELKDGDKIVVVYTNETVSKLLYQEIVSSSYLKFEDFDGQILTISQNNKRWWTATKSGDKWFLGDATNGYLTLTDQAGVSLATSDPTAVTINYDEESSKYYIQNTYYLSCRTSLAETNRYKWNGVSSKKDGYLLDLYRYNEGTGTTTYNSNPIADVQYDLTFDLNGATAGTQPAVAKHKQSDEITDFPSVEDFVKEGYRCIGWNTTNNATTALTSYTMPGEAATLYAVWIPTYAINWVVEGVTTHTDLPINGETISAPTTDPASINNRVFVGWSNTEITGHANTFTAFTSHTCTGETETWYAVFATPEYEVTTELEDKGTYIITSQKGGKIVYLPNAAATGGDGPALGKAIDINGTKISTIVTSDMLWTFNSIEGGWQIQSVAETDKYLGTTTGDGKTVRVNTSYNKAWTIADNTMKYNANESKCLYIGPYTADDHWYANSSSTSKTFASTTITFYTSANTYRNYTTAPSTATYSVVYDLNGGTGTAINQYELLTGASVTLPAAPSKFGYSFAGWSDGSQTYDAGAPYTIGSANVTLTAQWTILVPTSFTLASSNGYDLGTETTNTTQMSVTSWAPADLLDSQKGVTWSIKSGDEGYLTVNADGLVTVIGCAANATVVATSTADPNITAEFTVHIYAPFCPGYSFRYGTEGQADWNNCDPVCFTETDKADGDKGQYLWISDLFTIPAKPKFILWWEGHSEDWSELADMTAMPLHHLHNDKSLYKIENGKGLGATGYLIVYGGHDSKNKFIDFMPDGYVLRLGSGDIWTSVPFYADGDIWSTTWETDIVELTNDITSGNFYVGVKTAEDYVWLEGISKEREMTAMGKKSGSDTWGSNISSSDNGKHGKFRIYANSNDANGNWFCHFVPYYQIAFNTDGGSAVASGYVSIEADSKSYTVTMSPETNPTRVGYQFVGWNDGSTTHTESWTINNISQDINLTADWNKVNTLTFHYDGFTTDCDEQWSVATGTVVTLPNGREVVGKSFAGWLAQGSQTPMAAGSQYTMPAGDISLTATYTNWHITLNFNGTTSIQEVPETGVVLPTTVPDGAQGADNNIFIGFTKTQLDEAATDLPADFIAAGSVYTPAAAGEILYALYRQGDAEYKLIKDIKDLRLGAHVVLASIDEDYAMGNTFIKGQDTLPAIVVAKDGDEETITFGNEVQEWVLTTSSQAGSSAEYQGTWVFNRSDDKKLASSNTVGKVTLGTFVTTGSSFRIAIDASGRATVQCVANYNISTLSMGDKGAFGCYNPNTIDAPDLAIYQHIGTKYVTTPTAVYRVKSVDMVNGRLDKNDYYAEGTSIDLNGYANDGYSTSNRYLVLGETNRDTISKIKTFTMPAYNVVDTLTNRAKQDTIVFVVPECVQTQAIQRVDWNSVIELPEIADVNAWNFVGWVKTAINDTTENHTEIFTSYTVPHVDRDTFYAIYSYDGLETNGFVLSTVNSETTYYLGEYVPGSANRYFSAVTDKAQALVLHNKDNKLYYQSGDTVAYLKANEQSGSYNLLTTNEAGATVWTINKDEATNEIAISTTINASTRYLRFNSTYSRYNIYTDRQNPVWEKAPSYTTNPVCAQYAYYFTSDEEGAEPEYVYELGQDGKVIPYCPANECDAKRFIGWSETKVTALQQEAPTMVNVAIQTYDRDVNLYAVYAAPNGGKVVDTPTITDDVTAMGAFKTAQDSGMTSLNTRYFYHNAECYENTLRLKNGKNLDTSYITTSLIRDLEKIQVVYTNLKPIVSISSDRTSWTEINLTKVDEIYIATPNEPGDYYVAFSIKTSGSDNYSYSRISSITYTHNKAYWYSDYSTNCNTDETATISFKNEDESQAADPIDATSIGEVITLPTLKVAGQHFDHWTINDVEYEGGESYKLSHDVTAIATMSEAQLVCSPETLFVTSAKGKTVRSTQTIHITCPEITTGMLEIADVTADEGKTTFHAVITNAEANEETGLNATVAIEFTPNAQNQNRNATMTAIIGEKQVTFDVRGRSLPDKFVIAHQGTDSKWYALPADKTAYNTYTGYVVPVEDDKATATTNAIYHLGVDETDHSIVRFLATDTTALMTHATNNTQIKVGKIATDDNLSQWYLQTSNNSQYVLKNKVKAKNLTVSNDNKFGMFQNGDTLLRILPVANEVAVINLEVTQWETNGFTFLPSISIPTHDAFSLVVNEETIVGATCVDRYDLYDVNNIGSIGTQQTMQLQWFKDSKPVATATVVSPARVTGNITLSSLLTEGVDAKNLDIVVASGTLTVDAKATIHNLDICAGATVAIVNDTLTTNTLTFRGGLTDPTNGYAYEVPRLYIQKNECTTAPGYIKPAARVYYYLNVNSNSYYPFTVPYKAAIQNIHYASKPNTNIQSIYGNAIIISKYDGESRGANKPKDDQKYWKDLSYSNDLIPGVGYIITAKKQKNDTYATLRILMMVSDMDATTDTVAVGAWGVGPESTTAWYNQGWNYIANPYTAMLAGTDADEEHHSIQSGTEVRYATIPTPTIDGYDQVPMNEADLKPFYGFFIQASETGNYNFVKENRHQAPAYLLAEQAPEQEAYIQLSGEGMNDVFGLIAGNRYSDRYEINADLTKELGTANDLRAWLMSDETKMAYLAVNDETARTLIPLNLRTPAEGEYTFSLRKTSRVDDLEGLYLYDYQTGAVTNLILSDYSFTAPPGGVVDRFALSAIRMPKAPTDMNGLQEKENRMVVLKDGHIYILVNEAMYTAEGKEVTK